MMKKRKIDRNIQEAQELNNKTSLIFEIKFYGVCANFD